MADVFLPRPYPTITREVITPMQLKPMTNMDRIPVIDIFNYYIENSFAAYPDQKVSYKFFDILLKAGEEYPAIVAKEDTGEVVGFGMLRAYHPFPAFSKTSEISYFIKPEYTRQGVGHRILTHLIHKAEEKGISSILASISSLNEPSIRFHKRNGFIECGRFTKIGQKKGLFFDVVYMQKML
jgi:L-amino acid N-acyltransferase YncA